MGNIVNRVFDSSGPEGKVRGTPQQIIDKYNQLARDAQLSNDRVATENFQQHAEHYLRMLAEAQREQQERQAQQQQQQQERQQQRSAQGGGGRQGGEDGPSRDRAPVAAGEGEQPDIQAPVADAPESDPVIETAPDQPESALVETPEDSQPRQRRPRRKPEPDAAAGDQPTPDAAE